MATRATHDVGIGELFAQIKRHRAALEGAGALEERRRSRRRAELRALLVEEFTREIMTRVQADEELSLIDAHPRGASTPIPVSRGSSPGPSGTL